MASPSEIVRVSFSFYPTDVNALGTIVADLRENGAKVYRAVALRALIRAAAPAQLVEYGKALWKELTAKEGPREAENIADYPTVELEESDVSKLDDAVTVLLRDGVSANRAFVARAIVRKMPADVKIVPLVKKFVKEHPPAPRGWAARRAKAAKGKRG
jgi:hypothetical protein